MRKAEMMEQEFWQEKEEVECDEFNRCGECDEDGDWAFIAMKNNGTNPIIVPEDTYWYALEVLPPIYCVGGFAMGEQAGYNSQQATGTFYWFTKKAGVFYGLLGTKKDAQINFAKLA